jgi:zinc protease
MPSLKTHFEILPNGLALLLRETHFAPVVNLQIWAKVGSADERPGEEGLAHFHEHMLFKGTERRGLGEVAGEIEGAGGRVNAYTSFDTTVYYATLPSQALATGLDVLVDALRNSVFDEEEIRREREVVLEEIRRSQDSPAHVLSEAVIRESYRVHPYRSPILGPAENVARFDREGVTRFFRRWYTPDNLVVVAVGDFDAAELARALAGAFADAEPGGTTRARPCEPSQRELRTVILARHFEAVRLDLWWPGTAFSHPATPHLDLLSFALGECESSRLVRRVKEHEGLADRIETSAWAPLDPGLFSLSIDLDADRAEAAIEASVREVERLRQQPISTDELERARTNFLSGELFERESVSALAGKLGNFQVLGGDWRAEEHYLDEIRAASPADLLKAAREFLRPDGLSVGALLPQDESGAEPLNRARVEAAVARGLERAGRSFATPRRVATVSEIHSYQLANGASLHVRPRRDVPVVAARAAFLGGLLAEDENRAGLSSFLSSMWMRGTETRATADLARAVEALAADIHGFSGRSSLGLTLEVTSDKLEPALDLFAEVLLEPAFDPEELERERRDTLAAIDRRADQLAQQAYMLFAKTHFEHHPYRLSMIGGRESVEAFTAESVRDHHQRLIRAQNLAIGVAGDVDPDAVAEAFSVRLADLPSNSFEPPAPPGEPAPSEIREAELKKDRAQAHLVLGFRGVTVRDPDRVALELLAQLLAGQSGRLFLELRDRQSLAYSVGAVNVEGLAPGFFTVYIATAPDKAEEARSGILEQLARLLEKPVSHDELAKAQRHLTGNFAIDQQRNASHAAHISLDALYGLGPDAHCRWAEEIAAVTPEDLLRVSREVLRLDAYTLAIVRP